MKSLKIRFLIKDEDTNLQWFQYSNKGDLKTDHELLGLWMHDKNVEKMLAIGCKDIKGKDIYEGDIIEVHSDDDSNIYETTIEDIRNLPIGLDNCKVIGNIYSVK